MIVLDASIVVDLLTGGQSADLLRLAVTNGEVFIVPHLLDLEVMSALRKMTAGQRIESNRFKQIIESLAALPAERYSHMPLLDRIWELRHRFTCYDAAYIALAEATGSILYTSDAKLREGHRARVMVFTREGPLN